MVGYLTPETLPADTICRVLLIPNEQRMIANVTGALELLTFPENWTLFGAETPEDSALAMLDMFNAFCFKQGVCRVIGEIIAWAGATSPDSNWLFCNGDSIMRSDFPDLFTVIGTAYGADDVAHFNIPDLRGRAPVASGTGTGLTGHALADSYGEETHVITLAESPSHTHTDTGHTHAEGIAAPAVGAAIVGIPVPSAIPAVGVTGVGSAAISSSGGDGAHNNLGPRLAINFLIVAR